MIRRIIIVNFFNEKTPCILIYPIDQNLDSEKGTMLRRRIFKKFIKSIP